MNKPKFVKVLSTLAVSTLLLSACGGNGGGDKKSSSQKNVETNKFSSQVKMIKRSERWISYLWTCIWYTVCWYFKSCCL